MAIVIVGGSAKGVGKTALVCGLITALDQFRWTAVKITSETHESLPPVYEEQTAGPESDTSRYLAAGAERAFLLTVPSNRDLGEVLDEFWPRIGRGTNLIFESNRIVGHVTADVCLLVQGRLDLGAGKPSYYRAAPLADALVVQGDYDLTVPDAMKIEGQPRGPIFNLERLDRISVDMKGWMAKKLANSQ